MKKQNYVSPVPVCDPLLSGEQLTLAWKNWFGQVGHHLQELKTRVYALEQQLEKRT